MTYPTSAYDMAAAATDFLSLYPVTHYYTLTYAGRRQGSGSPYSAGERSLQGFHDWIDAMEWLQRRPLGWVRGDEVRASHWSGCGSPAVPLHHHGLLVGADDLAPGTAEALWKSTCGDAHVERYRVGGGAIPYSLKLAFSRIDGGNWDLGGLKAFSLHP